MAKWCISSVCKALCWMVVVFAPHFALQNCKARLLQEASALKREKSGTAGYIGILWLALTLTKIRSVLGLLTPLPENVAEWLAAGRCQGNCKPQITATKFGRASGSTLCIFNIYGKTAQINDKHYHLPRSNRDFPKQCWIIRG